MNQLVVKYNAGKFLSSFFPIFDIIKNLCIIIKLHNITFQYNNKKFNKKHLESCPVCYESGKNIIKYNCSHVICSTCLLSTITHTTILCCALCRANITHIYTQNKKILNEIKLQ